MMRQPADQASPPLYVTCEVGISGGWGGLYAYMHHAVAAGGAAPRSGRRKLQKIWLSKVQMYSENAPNLHIPPK